MIGEIIKDAVISEMLGFFSESAFFKRLLGNS